MSRYRLRGFSILILTLTLIAGARVAGASEAGKKAAKPHYEKGASEYNLGHFAEAISEFEKAYEQDPAPILLFNIAQAHRQSGNNERAAFFYRRYLEQEPNADNRADVEKRIKDLEAVIQQQNDLKRRPPTEVTDQDHRAKTTPGAPSPAVSAPLSAPPPQPVVMSSPSLPPPITPSSPRTDGPVAATIMGTVPEAETAHPIHVWVSAGPAFPSFSGRDLQEPTLLSLRLGANYGIDLHGAGVIDVGISGSYAPFQYTSIDPTAEKRSAGFWGLLADGNYRFRIAPGFDLLGEVGAGVVWWSGLGSNNPFTTDGVAATGAVPMPSLLLGLGAAYHVLPNLAVFFEPTFLLSKTTGDGLTSAISSVSRFDLAFGVGYSI
jgi:hypothetical protein